MVYWAIGVVAGSWVCALWASSARVHLEQRRSATTPARERALRIVRNGGWVLMAALALAFALALGVNALRTFAAVAQVAPSDKSTMLSAGIAELMITATVMSLILSALLAAVLIVRLLATVLLTDRVHSAATPR